MSEHANPPRDNREWHYRPDVPIPVSPIMSWPPQPVAWLRWLAGFWLALSSIVVSFGFAWAVYVWLQPDVIALKKLHWTWICQIWLRNAIMISVVAGGLHFWFYILKGQGRRLKFDRRDLAHDNSAYTFRNQVFDNMFWTLASGVTVWTAFESLYFWAAANGWAPGLTFVSNPIWFGLWFVLIPVWSSFHFYWIHRALHWPPLYRLAHALHHRNINTGPWSGISMHPVEHLIYFTTILIHFIVPSHPVHVLFHFYFNTLGPTFSHSGYDGVLAAGKRRMRTGDFFHQLHHRYFECNYGTSEMPWDVLFGSFHDGSEEATRATKARRQRMYG